MINLRAVFRTWIILTLLGCLFAQIVEPDSDSDQNSVIIQKKSSYIIIAPKVVRPGHVYKVVVTMLRVDYSAVFVKSSLSADGVQISSDSEEISQPGVSISLMMSVAGNSPNGQYKLRVECGTKGAENSIFSKEFELVYSSRSLTVVIQTNKASFNFHDIVRARIVILTTEQRPFENPVDIYIYNPQGFISRRWVSHQSSLGIASITYKVPSHPLTGWWKIRVVAQSQIVEEKFWVKRWDSSNIFVNIHAPAFVLNSNEYIEGNIRVNKTRTLAPIYGQVVYYAQVKLPNSRSRVIRETEKVVIEQFDGSYDFKIPMSELKALVSPLLGSEIEIRAHGVEYMTNNSHHGYVRVKIINEILSLRFLGPSPQIFKPGMPFTTYIAVSYHDQVPLDPELLAQSKLIISQDSSSNDGKDIVTQFPDSGVYKIKVKTANNANKIEFRARYEDGKHTKTASLVAITSYEPENRFIQISTSSTNGKVGNYIIFNIRTNFYIEQFYYIVMSKGIIQIAGTEVVEGYKYIVHPLAIPASSVMSPSTTLVVYAVSQNSLISDTLTVPVDESSDNELSFDLNMKKDRTGKSIEMDMVNYPGAMAFTSAIDTDSYNDQSRNELHPYSILNEMYKFELNRNKLQRVIWRSRERAHSSRKYFVTANYGLDSVQTFEAVGLVIQSDVNISNKTDPCKSYKKGFGEKTSTESSVSATNLLEDDKLNEKRYKQCLINNRNTFPVHHLLDDNCYDSQDDSLCGDDETFEQESALFFMTRKNVQPLMYDSTGKDFGWNDIHIGPNGDAQMYIDIPRRPTLWKFNIFCMHSKKGFKILDAPLTYDGRLPFYMTIEAPRSAVIYEQIGVRIAAYNYMHYEIEVLLEIKKSDKFKFVMVDGLGIVNHYSPQTTQSNVQHLIFVKPHSSKIVNIPVVAINEGKIEVVIVGKSQVGSDTVKTSIKIVPEGATQIQHTSILLNLRNVPIRLSYLNINITQTPEVRFETYRRYVWGSPTGQISVSGDVVGPTFPKLPISVEDLHLTGMKTGETKAFSFAYHLQMLRYLWVTDQWDPVLGKNVFNYLQTAYGDLLGMFNKKYFFQTNSKKPSVWLTAQVVRYLDKARISEWENFLYIDPNVIAKSIEFLVSRQKDDGSFYDADDYPLNRKMQPILTKRRVVDIYGQDTDRYVDVKENVTLTAQVLMALLPDNLDGILKSNASNARKKAANYLLRKLPTIKDSYTMALVTYALSFGESSNNEMAYLLLDEMKRSTNGLYYWAVEEVPGDNIFIQNQRPYLVPRKKTIYDSINVETTAYALLTYVRRENSIKDKIVEWLLKIKYSDAGFCSTQDTLVALEALIDYSYRSRIREVTDLKVDCNGPSIPGNTVEFTINQDNLSKQQKSVLVNPHGNLEAVARGGGLALLQLGYTFGVDEKQVMIPPPVKAFDLIITNTFSGRNSSNLHVNACVKWNLLEESERSGFTMLEIQLPTGYYLWQTAMTLHMKKFPNVSSSIIRDRVAKINFASVGNKFTCVDFTVNRWYPVANLTRYMLGRVYEYFSPELFAEEIIDLYSGHVLNICQVCGSFQCPYCPDFSKAVSSRVCNLALVIVSTVTSWVMWTSYG